MSPRQEDYLGMAFLCGLTLLLLRFVAC